MAQEARKINDINDLKCQSIYLNLLALREKQTEAIHWVREFEETKRCDGSYSFREERQAYRDHVGADVLDRVLTYQSRQGADVERVEQAVIHYFDWHHKRLVSALDWSN